MFHEILKYKNEKRIYLNDKKVRNLNVHIVTNYTIQNPKQNIVLMNIILFLFIILKDIGSVDCWGRGEENWVDTGLVYKNYNDVKVYTKQDNFKIKILELKVKQLNMKGNNKMDDEIKLAKDIDDCPNCPLYQNDCAWWLDIWRRWFQLSLLVVLE